jgi:hypothetical protein
MRSDPVTSDRWEPDGSGICQAFLVDDEGRFRFCIPATDPRRVPWRSQGTLRALLPAGEAAAYQAGETTETFTGYHADFFRAHQVSDASPDELAGLVAGLTLADRLVGRGGSAAVRRAVLPPARLLGEFLADNGYLLVRPCGGWNARGTSGAMPAMEYPIARALESIAGGDFASRLDFHGALGRAGNARNLDGPIRALVAASIAGTIVVAPLVAALGDLSPLAGGPLGALAGTAVQAAAALIGPVHIGTALALYLHRDCFDVSWDQTASEVAGAYLLKEIPPQLRFAAWMAAMQRGVGKYALGFPPHVALSALDDPDPTVRDEYVALFRAVRAAAAPVDLEPGMLDSARATAVAVLHGATEFEPLLLQQLDARYDLLFPAKDVPIGADGTQEPRLAYDYLAAIAVAWLHERRAAGAGTPVATPGFPVAPTDVSSWAAPVVPQLVLERLPEVRRVVLGDRPLPSGDVDAFGPLVDSRKPPVPRVSVPPVGPLLGEFTYDVPESARDVFTGIMLQWGDAYEIEATGEIWAGVAFTGRNGPAGWTDRVVDDARWPLHSGLDPDRAHPFALLARVGGWFYVGEHLPQRRFLNPRPLPLHLRINDDVPGNGSGAFQVTVRVWGTPRQIGRPGHVIQCATREQGRVARVGGVHADGSRWQLTVPEAVEWIERYGHVFSTATDDGPRVTVVRLRDRPFLRSRGDRTRTNNLRRLPACPAA